MRCLRTPILIIFEFCIAVRKWDYVRLLFGEDARLCLTHFLNSPGRYFRVPLPRLSKSRLDVMDIAKMWPIDTHRRKIESLLLFAGVHIQMRSCCGHWLQFLTDRGCCSLALTWPHGCFKMFSGQTCATMAVFSWGQTTGRSDCHNTRWCQALISEHHWDKHVMFKHVQTILVNFDQTICQIVAERCRTQLNATDKVTILQTVESSEVKSLLLRFLEQLEVSSDRSLKAHSNIMRALSEHRMSISWVLCHLCILMLLCIQYTWFSLWTALWKLLWRGWQKRICRRSKKNTPQRLDCNDNDAVRHSARQSNHIDSNVLRMLKSVCLGSVARLSRWAKYCRCSGIRAWRLLSLHFLDFLVHGVQSDVRSEILSAYVNLWNQLINIPNDGRSAC